MWWILQILASLAILATLTYSKTAGLTLSTYATYVIIQVTFVAWCIPISYAKAPSFIQAWFVGAAVFTLGGFAVSFFYLKEVVNMHNYVGVVITVIGSILIIL